jgi:hypothetical protein
MAGLVNAAKNSMLDQLGTLAAYASLHSADPGTSGTSELTGGSPAYARKAISWNAAASGSKTNSGSLTFDVPSSSTVAYIGYWSASSGGTFYGSRAVSASETFAGQGTYTVAASGLTESMP